MLWWNPLGFLDFGLLLHTLTFSTIVPAATIHRGHNY
jgi:hypothetical protein